METGGGIVQARDLIGDKPFLVVNSDNLWVDGPVDAIRAARRRAGTMRRWTRCCSWCRWPRAYNHGGQGDFHLDPDGRITERRKPGGRRRSSIPASRSCRRA